MRVVCFLCVCVACCVTVDFWRLAPNEKQNLNNTLDTHTAL